MEWVEFISRMILASIIVVPAGMVLLWAARLWSGTGTSALHQRSVVGTRGPERQEASAIGPEPHRSVLGPQPAGK